jgi:hypothetical protein
MTNTRRTEHLKPILVSLPISVIQELNDASRTLNCSRSHLIRKSLKRDLRFVVEHEVAEATELQQKASDGYERWLNQEKTETDKRPTVKKHRIKGFKEWLQSDADAKAPSSVVSKASDYKQQVASGLRAFATKPSTRSTRKTD